MNTQQLAAFQSAELWARAYLITFLSQVSRSSWAAIGISHGMLNMCWKQIFFPIRNSYDIQSVVAMFTLLINNLNCYFLILNRAFCGAKKKMIKRFTLQPAQQLLLSSAYERGWRLSSRVLDIVSVFVTAWSFYNDKSFLLKNVFELVSKNAVCYQRQKLHEEALPGATKCFQSNKFLQE